MLKLGANPSTHLYTHPPPPPPRGGVYWGGGQKHGKRVLRYYCPPAYLERSRGWGEGPTEEFSPPPIPPPHGRPLPVEDGGTEGRVGLDMSLPSLPSPALDLALMCPLGTAELLHQAPQGAVSQMGAATLKPQ